MQDPVRQHATRFRHVVLVAGAVNLVGALTKLIAGELTRSVGMSADGVHAALDALASGIALVGISLAARPPDLRHPYGYERYESVAPMAIGGFLVLAFMRILGEALSRLWRPEAVAVPWISIAIMGGRFWRADGSPGENTARAGRWGATCSRPMRPTPVVMCWPRSRFSPV